MVTASDPDGPGRGSRAVDHVGTLLPNPRDAREASRRQRANARFAGGWLIYGTAAVDAAIARFVVGGDVGGDGVRDGNPIDAAGAAEGATRHQGSAVGVGRAAARLDEGGIDGGLARFAGRGRAGLGRPGVGGGGGSSLEGGSSLAVDGAPAELGVCG